MVVKNVKPDDEDPALTAFYEQFEVQRLGPPLDEEDAQVQMAAATPSPAEYEARRIAAMSRSHKYPWEKWDDGKWHVIVRGEDFNVAIPIMQTQIHRYAARHDKVACAYKISDTQISLGIFASRFAQSQAKMGIVGDFST
jgi:hypothetical protein